MNMAGAKRFLFPAALALNAFLAVVLVMVLTRDGPPPPPPSPGAMAERMADGLPAADAAILREAFAAHAPDMGEVDADMRNMHDRIRAILLAPEFDEAALRAVFADGRAARGRMDSSFEAAFIDAVKRISAEGRRKLSRWEPPPPK